MSPPKPFDATLSCALGSFALRDPEAPSAPTLGCPPAEAWLAGRRGARLAYETLADRPLRIALRPAAGEPGPRPGYALGSPEGRWLRCGGRLELSDGERALELAWPAGDWRVIWYARADLALFEREGEATDGELPADAPDHLLELAPLAADEPRPQAALIDAHEAYRCWHAIQRETEPQPLLELLDSNDPRAWVAPAALRRLAETGASDTLAALAADPTRGLTAVLARRLIDQPPTPFSLDELPAPTDALADEPSLQTNTP